MNNEYWVKLTKRMNFQKYTKYTKYYNKLLNIVLSEKFEWFKKIELNDIQVGNIYESKNLIPIGKIYVDSIWGYNQWKEYHYDSSFPTDGEVSFGDIIGGDLSKEIQEQFKLCFSQVIGSLKPKYMCFSWLEMVLVDEDDNTLQESIRRILREETEMPPMLRRRLNEIPKYIRSAYKWLNAKAFGSFNEFIKRVIFSTTRDFVGEYGTNDYYKNLEIIDELTPYISKIIYDDYLDEIKKYFHKEISK